MQAVVGLQCRAQHVMCSSPVVQPPLITAVLQQQLQIDDPGGEREVVMSCDVTWSHVTHLPAWCSSCAIELSTLSCHAPRSFLWAAPGWGSSYLRETQPLQEERERGRKE